MYKQWTGLNHERLRAKAVFYREIRKFVEERRPTVASKRVAAFELKQKIDTAGLGDGQPPAPSDHVHSTTSGH